MTHLNNKIQILSERGRTCIPVPWHQADKLHNKLKTLGYGSTLYLDPEDYHAHLELWPGVDPDGVMAALAA